MQRSQVSTLIGLILIGTIGVIILLQLGLAVGDFLVIQDDLEAAELIHVISGPDHRTNYAIQLYLDGFARQIFFTGGWCDYHQLYHGQHGKELAIAQGVPSEAILMDESPVMSTYAEAELLKAYLDEHGSAIHSLIIVSDPFHMRRVQWTYQHLFGSEIDIQMAPVPFDATTYDRNWWRDLESTQMVLSEYAKLFYYVARYQLSSGKLTEWLASLDRK